MATQQVAGAVRTIGTGETRDVGYAPDGATIYIAVNGRIVAYDSITGASKGEWEVGTSLGGIDISPDGRFLVVTEYASGPVTGSGNDRTSDWYVYRLDLTDGTRTVYTSTLVGDTSNYVDASFLSDGSVLLSRDYPGSGPTPLTKLDFATGAFSTIEGDFAESGIMTGSTDRSHILLSAGRSDAPFCIYTAGRGITASRQGQRDNGFNGGAQAISNDGTLVAQGGGLNIYDGSLNLLVKLGERFPYFTATISGVVFSQSGDRLFVLDSASATVISFRTSDWSLQATYKMGGAVVTPGAGFGNALLLSPDGANLLVTGREALSIIDLDLARSDGGTPGDDMLLGDSWSGALYGYEGDDVLDSGDGGVPSALYGGRGNDTYYLRNAYDRAYELAGDTGNDVVYASFNYNALQPGIETIILVGSAISATGNSGAETLMGNARDNILSGEGGNDTLVGGDGNDYLNGGAGADRMDGGSGNDTYVIDNPSDIVLEASGMGDDTVISDISFILPAQVETLRLRGASARLNGTGNALDNRLNGNPGDNVLTGLAGNDRIDGGAGKDVASFLSTSTDAEARLDANGSIRLDSSDGNDTLYNIETLRFADRDVSTARFVEIERTYVAVGGRASRLAELITWTDALAAGRTITDVRTAIINDELGAQAIDAVYREGFARAATSGEIEVWRASFRGGSDLSTLRGVIMQEAGRIEQVVDGIYRDFGGRRADAAELGYWRGQITSGLPVESLRAIIIEDVLGAQGIAEDYQDLFGRAPNADELAYWRGAFKGGTPAAALNSAILDSAEGLARADAAVTQLYREFGGRAPVATELEAWRGAIRGGFNLDDVRDVIVEDALGARAIDGEYRTYMGRAASAGEIDGWQEAFKTGTPASTLRTAIVSTSEGAAHSETVINGLYQDYFDRGASTDEVGVWLDLFRSGASADTLLETLFTHPEASVVQLAGQARPETFAIGGVDHYAVRGFNPFDDTLDLRGSALAGMDVLAGAREIMAFDGRVDVLLGGGDVLLIGLHLSQLSSSDFMV